ncbi:uncharacterized protein V1516DRAFT_673183 [Lipomyces oligophaga]|uniref:uncharacterized protein n=1 Tax=Lipomyces oligophaga TaxID=45792 RepID=UPI0034CF4402
MAAAEPSQYPHPFSGFFWTSDYIQGLRVLQDKLAAGIEENNIIVQMMETVAAAEATYGEEIQKRQRAQARSNSGTIGFEREGIDSLRAMYAKFTRTLSEKAQSHLRFAASIREAAIEPFNKFSKKYEEVVVRSTEAAIREAVDLNKLFQRTVTANRKYCHEQDALLRLKQQEAVGSKESNTDSNSDSASTDGTFTSGSAAAWPQAARQAFLNFSRSTTLSDDNFDDDDVIYDIGIREMTKAQMRSFLNEMIDAVPLSERQRPVYLGGNLSDCAPGSVFCMWLSKRLTITVEAAELVGQHLIEAGFLRDATPLATDGFVNSSNKYYQVRRKAFEVGGRVLDDSMLSPLVRQERQTETARALYHESVRMHDQARCKVEEQLVMHFWAMGKWEQERVKELKEALNTFAMVSMNIVPQMKELVESLSSLQENLSIEDCMRQMRDRYAVGQFHPRVIRFENAFTSNEGLQTFGVSLQERYLFEGKVPSIVRCSVMYLEAAAEQCSSYSDAQQMWLRPVWLGTVHGLRKRLNTGKVISKEEFAQACEGYSTFAVANMLKLYFYELPESVVHPDGYDRLKAYYSNKTHLEIRRNADGLTGEDQEVGLERKEDDVQIDRLVDLIGDMEESHRQTLKWVVLMFCRLIAVTSSVDKSDEPTFAQRLAAELGRCFLRPLEETSMTARDTVGYRLVLDLFKYGNSVFDRLQQSGPKRRNSGRMRGNQRNSPDGAPTPTIISELVSGDTNENLGNRSADARTPDRARRGGLAVLSPGTGLRSVSPSPRGAGHTNGSSAEGSFPKPLLLPQLLGVNSPGSASTTTSSPPPAGSGTDDIDDESLALGSTLGRTSHRRSLTAGQARTLIGSYRESTMTVDQKEVPADAEQTQPLESVGATQDEPIS